MSVQETRGVLASSCMAKISPVVKTPPVRRPRINVVASSPGEAALAVIIPCVSKKRVRRPGSSGFFESTGPKDRTSKFEGLVVANPLQQSKMIMQSRGFRCCKIFCTEEPWYI